MSSPIPSPRRGGISILLVTMLYFLIGSTAATRIRGGADPSIMKVRDRYYSANSDGPNIWVHTASSLEGLNTSSEARKVWSDTASRGDVWAPEITMDGGKIYIYFTAGKNAAHRMYVISAETPLGPYTGEQKLSLPDDQWAIDGTMFSFKGQHWLVWSGWEYQTPRTLSNHCTSAV
jgi:GH43 family beta-xylosidase